MGRIVNSTFKLTITHVITLLITCCYSLCLIILLYPQISFSASRIEVTVKQPTLVAHQRGIVTLPFTVTNRSNSTVNLTENINLPDGWRILATSGSFTLRANERTVRLIHILASSEVPAGSYTLPYQVTSQDHLSIHAEENIRVIIKSNSTLSITVVESPSIVLAGEEYFTKVRVTNNGNVTTPLDIKIKDRMGYITSFTPKSFSLSPSQSSEIIITSKVPSSLKNTTHHTFKLKINGKKSSFEKTIKTRIFSRIAEGIGQYHTLPVRISGNYTASSNNTNSNDTNSNDTNSNNSTGTQENTRTFQTELSANGSLDEEGIHTIDLLIRDQQTLTTSSLGQDSEMRMLYGNPDMDLQVGDISIPIAGISDNGFYGEGAEIEYHPADKNWYLRVFNAKENRSFIDEEQQDENDSSARKPPSLATLKGIEVGMHVEDNLEVIANLLLKNDDNNSQQSEHLAGFEVQWDKSDDLAILFSYALDDDGDAFRYEQIGTYEDVNYNLQLQQADALFDGQIKDIKSESATGIYAFNEDINYLKGSLYHSQRNTLRNNTLPQLDEKIARLGIGHYFNETHRDSLFAETFLRLEKDEREVSSQDHSDKGIRLEYQKSISDHLFLNTNIEFSYEKDRVKKLSSRINRESITLAYAPNDRYHAGFNIDNAESIQDQYDTLSYGLNAAIHFSDRQHLSGYWRHSDQFTTNTDKFQINYQHSFSNGLILGLSASTDTQANRKDTTDYLLSVSMPFDVPIYKRKNVSSIKGRVINNESHRPIANAIVNIAGQYAVSDEQGYYQFKAIPAGKYAISTDLNRTQLTINYRIEDELQNITLSANQAVVHNIELTAGTGLEGQVRRYITSTSSIFQNKSDGLTPSDGIARLLVTLISTDDSEIVHKSLTTEGGFFSFNGIKAGQWQIQVTDPQKVMSDARLNKPHRLLNLKVGDNQEIEFKAIPLLKKIQKIGPTNGFSVSGE